MRTYGVVEADIDVHEIWETARKLGFANIKLAAYTPHPQFLALAEFDDLIMGGEFFSGFARTARNGLTAVRNFFLYKDGFERMDSRRSEGLRAHLDVTLEGKTVHAKLENIGTTEWLPGHESPGGVALGCHVYGERGQLLDFDLHWEGLPHAVPPGGTAELTFALPPLPEGAYELEFDAVAAQVLWFAQAGSTTVRVRAFGVR
jgi:hypothetical protein